MAGLGLESLIPKKKDSSSEPFSRTDRPPVPAAVGDPASRLGDSDFVGDQARRDSETFSQTIPKSKTKVYQESIFHIEVEKIKPNPYQPRREFDAESLKELGQSIREFGIIQPLVVSKVVNETETGTQVEYQLIAGERRLKAAKIVGLERVPAIVKKIDLDRTKLEMALIENVQRSDLNSFEAAKAYARLQDEFNLTQREIASRVGKSRETVANTLRLLNLPSHIQEAIAKNKINESQARALLAIQNAEEQERVFQNLLNQKITAQKIREKVFPQNDPEKIYWEKQLEEKLGAPVKVFKQGEKGKMIIQFYSKDEWQSILDKLLGNEPQ